MRTMGTLALGIGSWLKFGKNTMSIAAGRSETRQSTSSDMATLASTQLNKVKSNQM
jgi:hypothetical protein